MSQEPFLWDRGWCERVFTILGFQDSDLARAGVSHRSMAKRCCISNTVWIVAPSDWCGPIDGLVAAQRLHTSFTSLLMVRSGRSRSWVVELGNGC